MQLKSWALAVVFILLVMPVRAHHSHTNYNMSEYVTVEGTVVEIHWVNPHAFVYIEVEGTDGATDLWALEATGPGGLQRNGVDRNLLQVGDTVTARCHQLRDGSNGCLLGYMTGPDGVERHWD
ncbi:MAG TPA: DUF6152 family protein [Gammaproteobacteria bacterium]|jgi:hypothetical protein